jgi:hypothetical protein
MVESLRDFLSAWKDFRVEADEYREPETSGAHARPLPRARQGKRTELRQMFRKGASLFHIRSGG